MVTFDIRKSVHHHTNQIYQQDATVSQIYYLTLMCGSTCFGRPHAHHQELNNCGSSLWFYRWSVVVAVLLVMVGPVCSSFRMAMRSKFECVSVTIAVLYFINNIYQALC